MLNVYSQSVPTYCERLGTSLLSEPTNLISNLAFFIAGFLAYKMVVKQKLGAPYKIIVFIIFAIGIGSSAWHSIRTPFAHAMDFLPIFTFFLVYLYLLVKKLTANKYLPALLTLGFLILQITMSYMFVTVLNGSIRHVVNLCVLLGLFYILKRQKKLNIYFLWIFISYLLAVVFRILDKSVCSYVLIGTHFLWHIFTASAIYFAFRSLVQIDEPASIPDK